jgi:hypothetical protein
MRTHTKFFSFSKLANSEGASTVVRVAMVCNDLAIANSSMGHYKNLPSKALSHIRQGAPLYFVKMSCGHLQEGMKTIQEIVDHPTLALLVNKCEHRAQSAFADLCECLPTGKDNADFRRYVQPVRNKTAFHYDPNEVAAALRFRKTQHPNSPCSMTIGEDVHSSRFDFADVVLDTIVCRNLWGIPVTADVRSEANQIADWCFKRSVQFLAFGGDFVTRFLQEHA